MLTQVKHLSKDFQQVSKYSIKKKKSVSSDGNVSTTISYNGKGQYKKVVTQYTNDTTTKTYKYYSDGNLKKLTTTDNMGSTQVVRFNKKGYLKSFLMKSPSVTITTTYSYKYKKGKLRECIVTVWVAGIPPCRSSSIRNGGKSAGQGTVMGMKTSGVSVLSQLLMHVADHRTTL